MSDWLINNDAWLRLAFFGCVFVVCILVQRLIPKKQIRQTATHRSLNNLIMPVAAGLLARLVTPLLPIFVAAWATEQGLGLFNVLAAPAVIAAGVSIVSLDLAIYWQHRLMHRVPLLWRLHRMHHSDTALDVTTGVRFHPGEFLISLIYKSTLVILLGAPVIAVLIFEVLLNAASLFNHSNIGLRPQTDKLLRWFLVTPDMHRIHHSTNPSETNSNFSFSVPYWDYCFGSYTPEPSKPYDSMPIGLDEFRSSQEQTLLALLRQPIDP